MIIDFHTHMFPKQIAESTITYLAEFSGLTPSTDGSREGLLKSCEHAGIDHAVVLPVMTKPSQFHTLNEYASNFLSGKLISFGGIHPDTPEPKAALRRIKSMGLQGIKLHPDFQKTKINDVRYKRIISFASELGLIISVHAGVDPATRKGVYCTPKLEREVLLDTQAERLIFAHMGGTFLWDEVEEYLVGEQIYLDTGAVLDLMSQEQFLRIVKNHGADKILFASDAPWGNQGKYVRILQRMSLDEEEKEKIFSKNARKLLTL